MCAISGGKDPGREGAAPPMDDVNRRRLLKSLIGGGIVTSNFSLLYTILIFILPPKTQGSGAETMGVAQGLELKPNSGTVFTARQPTCAINPHSRGRTPRLQTRRPPSTHGAR